MTQSVLSQLESSPDVRTSWPATADLTDLRREKLPARNGRSQNAFNDAEETGLFPDLLKREVCDWSLQRHQKVFWPEIKDARETQVP